MAVRSLAGNSSLILAVVARVVCGVVLVLMAVMAWNGMRDVKQRQTLISDWAKTDEYAVFFPLHNGDDASRIMAGDNTIWITVARDLYPVLDEAGAIYIETSNYRPLAFDLNAPVNAGLPVPPIYVNTNFIERYPILDEYGHRIEISREEKAWIVAVPQQYKAEEAGIMAFYKSDRVDYAVNDQERIVGDPVPDWFRDQEVRIVWMASGQEVFSFNSAVNPQGGNIIIDPIVQIMTPANSLTFDRLNSVTGGIDTALKVRVDGDPAGVMRSLTPLLKELQLDDNLRQLVTPNQARLKELNHLNTANRWLMVAAGLAFVVMLGLSVSTVSIYSDRRRRTLTIRRLHGLSFGRTYRELLLLLSAIWCVQALLLGAIRQGMMANRPEVLEAARSSLAIWPWLTVLAVALLVDVAFVAVATGFLERRHLVVRVKEM